MCNPRVYVGTYWKYNNGSLKGGWVSLSECKDYKEFLSKCRALHRGERDPEYMIQDSEDFPDGLNCGEWLSEQDFKDVIEAMREDPAPDPSPIGAGSSISEQLRAALMIRLSMKGAKAAPKQADDKLLLEEYIQEMAKAWPKNKGMLDYYRKEWSGGVRLQNGGILCFEKPRIKTEFCFGYSSCGQGSEYDEAQKECRAASSENYFLHENLDDMDEEIRALELNCRYPDGEYGSRYDGKEWYLIRASYSGEVAPMNVYKHQALRHWDIEEHPDWYKGAEKMSEEDRLTILAGLKREREKFDKRLKTYLKRYGTSKLRTWTYWLDE